ncbi:MAG: hypothetical protein ACP5GJ_04445, partial [Nanopusillaceae archaeon]
SATLSGIGSLTASAPFTTLTVVKDYVGYTVSPTDYQISFESSGISVTSQQTSVQQTTSSGSVYYYLDQAGAFAQLSTSSTSDSLTIYVPQSPVTYNLALAPVGAQTQTQTITLGVGQTVPGTNYVVEGVSGVSTTGYTQPTALVGKVILDTQVTPGMSNLVLVGGPAVNALTAQAVIQYVSQMNSALGQQLQAEANSQGGYVYGSELAPVLQQLGINFGPGTALIMTSTLYPNTLVIFGWSGNDTTQATELFANYLVYGTDASQLDNYSVVLVNDQQTVNGEPAVQPVQ